MSGFMNAARLVAGRNKDVLYPIFSSANVFMALHMDGADSGTVFTDDAGGTIVRSAAITDSDVKKYGTASGFFNGGAYLYRSGTATAIGTANLTVSMFVKATGNQSDIFLVGFRPQGSATGDLLITTGSAAAGTAEGVLRFSLGGNNGGGTTRIDNGNWNHIALVRSGTNIKLFVNGVKEYDVTNAAFGHSISANSNRPAIASNDYSLGGNSFSGWIDDLLIVKEALWSSNFIPPTVPFSF